MLFLNSEFYLHRVRKKERTNTDLQLQKFTFEDGFIACSHNQNLVLGVKETEQEGRIIDVVLVKRRTDDIYQRWVIKDNG